MRRNSYHPFVERPKELYIFYCLLLRLCLFSLPAAAVSLYLSLSLSMFSFAAHQFDINPSEREAWPHFAQHCSQTFLQQNIFHFSRELLQLCGFTKKHPAIFGSRWMSGPTRTKPAKRSCEVKIMLSCPRLVIELVNYQYLGLKD